MKKLFMKIPNTDGWYHVWTENNDFLGTVKKTYSGRSTYYWLAYDPVDEDTSGLRIGFASRADAAHTLYMRSLGQKFSYPLY